MEAEASLDVAQHSDLYFAPWLLEFIEEFPLHITLMLMLVYRKQRFSVPCEFSLTFYQQVAHILSYNLNPKGSETCTVKCDVTS